MTYRVSFTVDRQYVPTARAEVLGIMSAANLQAEPMADEAEELCTCGHPRGSHVLMWGAVPQVPAECESCDRCEQYESRSGEAG